MGQDIKRGQPGNAGQFAPDTTGKTRVPTPADLPRIRRTPPPADRTGGVDATYAAYQRAGAARSTVTTPGGWILTAHVRDMAARKGINTDALIACVDTPATTYESHRYPGQRKHTRDGIAVAVDPASRTVITCFVDREHTPLRADQTDADAQAYARVHPSDASPAGTSAGGGNGPVDPTPTGGTGDLDDPHADLRTALTEAQAYWQQVKAWAHPGTGDLEGEQTLHDAHERLIAAQAALDDAGAR